MLHVAFTHPLLMHFFCSIHCYACCFLITTCFRKDPFEKLKYEEIRLGVQQKKDGKNADTDTQYKNYHDGRITVHCYSNINDRLHFALLRKTAVYSRKDQGETKITLLSSLQDRMSIWLLKPDTCCHISPCNTKAHS